MKRFAVVAVFTALLVPAAASAGSVDLLRTLSVQLPKVKQLTTVPILLPRTLPLAGSVPRLYPVGAGSRNAWLFDLAGARGCGSANACFVASFEGRRGSRLPGKANARLAGGDAALYHPITCGASCAPASLWFVHGGVLYSWQVKDPPKNAKAVLVRLANEAIAAGSR